MTPDSRGALAVTSVLAFTLLPLGAVGPLELVGAHLAVLWSLLVLVRSGAGAGRDYLAALLPSVLAVGLGLVWLPHGLLEVLSPGLAATRASGYTLSLRPEATVDVLALLSLLAGAVCVFAGALSIGVTRPDLRRGLSWAAVVWAGFGLIHASLGLDHLLGFIDVRAADGRFFAPLVNPNHHGLVLMATWPLVLTTARESALTLRTSPLWATVGWTFVFPVAASSMGLLLVLAVQLAFVAGRGPGLMVRRVVLALGGALMVGVASWMLVRGQPEWWALSGAPRLQQWQDTLVMWWAHPWFGTGAGTYAFAYPPWRTVKQFATFDHAHADLLQLAAELGVVGLAALALGAALAPKGGTRGPDGPWFLGLLAMCTHGLVDFPWRIPGLVVLAALLWVAWAGPRPAPRSVPLTRLLVAAQVLGLLWTGARHVEVVLARRALSGQAAAGELEWLSRWAFWRGEPLAIALRTSDLKQTRGLAEQIRREHPDDAALLRVAAQRLYAVDAPVDARELLLASRARDPNDFRTWLLAARWSAAEGDGVGAAEAWAEAFRRWPREMMADAGVFDEAYEQFPLGIWWVDALGDAPAHWSVRLSWRLLADGDLDSALMAAEQAGRLRPSVHRYLPVTADALARGGDLDGAESYLREWTDSQPDAVWAWVTLANLGQAHDRPGWVGEGLAHALALDPGHPRIRRTAQRLMKAGEGCPAPDCLLGGPAARLWLADAARRDGDRTRCEALLTQVAEVSAGLDLWWDCSDP